MQNSNPIGPTSEQTKIIEDAVALHQSGQLNLAEIQYKKLLNLFPGNTNLLTKLGTIAFQRGRLEDGVRIIGKSLNIDPNQPNSLINIGVALRNFKRLNEALTSFDRAIALKPDYPSAHLNRGNVLRDLNRLDEALESYDYAIALNPDYAKSYSNRGYALQLLNRLDEALISYDCAIAHKPDFSEAHFNRGNALQLLKQLDEALASFDRAIALKPDYPVAHSNRGNVLRDLNRLDEALESYDYAIALNPDYAKSYSNRGYALQLLNRLDEALISYDCAIALKPDFAEAHCNRGNALQLLKQLDEALASFDRAIALKPDYPVAHSNRGNVLKDLKQVDEALASYDCAVALNLDFAEAHSNRGIALIELKRLDEALASFDRAIEINPNFSEAYWNKALIKITLGEYLEGWKLYEWRWKGEPLINRLRHYHQPLWLGDQSLINKTLFIYPEQGFGDNIQCIRYAAVAEQLGAKVILEVPSELMALSSTLKGSPILIEKGKPLPRFDYHCPVMSLPLAFKTTVETIPAQIPYLHAEEKRKKRWNQKIGNKTVKRIGLAWSGSINHKNDYKRSFSLITLAKLIEMPFEFHSLQKEVREIDIKTLADFPKIHQHQEDLLDFSDTAALIDAMDLVVSVDTSVAHLAGAMGKKTFILLSYSPDFRWMLERTDSPWYPTATLFRQPAMGDWDSVISEITQSLSN